MGSMLLISSKTSPESNVYGGFALLFLPPVRECCLFSSSTVCYYDLAGSAEPRILISQTARHISRIALVECEMPYLSLSRIRNV